MIPSMICASAAKYYNSIPAEMPAETGDGGIPDFLGGRCLNQDLQD